jgi:hypothetical protein
MEQTRACVSSGSPFEIANRVFALRVGNVIAISGTAPLSADGRTVCVGDVAG